MNYSDSTYLESNPTWHSEDSPWKASQCYAMINRNGIRPRTITEIGCGAGGVLKELSSKFPGAKCKGFDISTDAIRLAKTHSSENISFHLGEPTERSDLLLVIDVFEHVQDYIGFIEKCKTLAEYKLFHIPLDLHSMSVFRDTFLRTRKQYGHLHYFTESSALATLKDSGYEIVDVFHTNSESDLFWVHPSWKRAIAVSVRWPLSKISRSFTARVLGGYSLMVLAK